MSNERAAAPISIPEAVSGLDRPFEPRDLVTVNDAIVRIAAVEGEFPWHHHDEDELFLWPVGDPIEQLELFGERVAPLLDV